MTTTTSAKTIAVLQEMFSRFGLPRELVSDNGPQFMSEEFKQFMTANGIKHICCSPYHPASNGAAERFVQTVKQALCAGHSAGIPLEKCLLSFLLRYRTTPHATTGVAPCTLMFRRDLRTRLHLINPDVGAHVRRQQAKQKTYHDCHCTARDFCIGQSVWARNFREGSPWIRAVVSDKLGPVTYLVHLENGDYWKRHVDHLREASVKPPDEFQADEATEDFPVSLPHAAGRPEQSGSAKDNYVST